MPEVTWKDIAELLERVGRLEERLKATNVELDTIRNHLSSLDEGVKALAAQLVETRNLLSTNLNFYKKLAYRTIVIIIAALASSIAAILTRVIG